MIDHLPHLPFLCGGKKRNRMKSIYIGVIALGLMGPRLSYADDIPTNENDTIRSYQIDEVTITSSNKETNDLRVLPGAVSVISPLMISSMRIGTLKDISAFVPNLYIPDYGSRLTSAIYIRGIGARSSGQSVGLYVDDAPYLDKSTFDFELTDIQRVEILRGPQGTLYGRNAMGGIINIYTLSPFDFQGKRLSLSAGSYGQYKLKASHYGKLSETLGFTAALYYNHQDGFYTNAYDGEKVDKENNVGGRLKIEGHFNPNFRASYSLSADYVDQGAFPYGLFTGSGNTDHERVSPVNYNDPGAYRRTMLSNNLSFEYRNERVLLSSTTGYQYFKDDMKMDQDFSPRSVFTLNQRQKQHALSEELAVKSVAESDYRWSFGLYGFYENLDTEGPVDFKEDGIATVLQPMFDQLKEQYPKMPYLKILDEHLYIPGSFQTPSFGLALYHQSTYDNLFTEGLSITAGVRLDYERQKMDYQSEAKMRMGFSFSENGPFMDIDRFFQIPATTIDASLSQDFWQVLPKVSLKYECAPGTLTYLSVAKGYKAGGYNVQMSADIMQERMRYDMMSAFKDMMQMELQEPAPIEEVAAYKPEKSWNYELGIRSELVDHRLSAELTGFYMDIQDVQLTKFVNSGNGRILTNAGKARSYGVEASLHALLAQGLTADVNYGFTRASFRDYDNGQEDFAGNAIPYTPRHTLGASLRYTRLFHDALIDQFNASARFNGTGKIYWTERNDIYQRFYGTLDAKVGVRKGIVSVNLWSRNITNTRYAAFYFESFDNPFIQLGKPFQIGAEVAIAF